MAYLPRLSANDPTPISGNRWYYADNWYQQNGYGPPAVTGNCTWYAYGRFNEIRQTLTPQLSLRTAKYWWDDPPMQSFQRGQTPMLGAIMCWANQNGQAPNAPGHVAIVEVIHDNGDITFSESGYPNLYFATERVTAADGYTSSWMRVNYRQYTLQGFIYQPNAVLGEWIADTGFTVYAKESAEAYNNALLIYSALYSYGWTLNAVCGLLGSIDIESGYNPWLWENGIALASTDPSMQTSRVNGYGLVQWTPPGDYIGNSVAMQSPFYAPYMADVQGNKNDGYAQLYAIHNQTGQYYSTTNYPESYAEYQKSTKSPEYLASAWLYNYERPLMTTPPDDPGFENRRRVAARYWFDKLQGVSPSPVPPSPSPLPRRKMPLWYYMKPNKNVSL